MDTCEICKKEARAEPFFYSLQEVYLCKPHARELIKELGKAKATYQPEIRTAVPNTPEWSKLCKMQEKVVVAFVKNKTKTI